MKVTHNESGRVYAMKSIQVPALIKQKQVSRAKVEVDILKTLNHPFLVRLHYSFVDATNQLCMCLDYAYGKFCSLCFTKAALQAGIYSLNSKSIGTRRAKSDSQSELVGTELLLSYVLFRCLKWAST